GRATFQHRAARHEAEPQAIVEHREVLAGRHGLVRALAVDIAKMCANKTRAGSFEEDEPRVDHDAATRAGYVCTRFEGASRSRFDEYSGVPQRGENTRLKVRLVPSSRDLGGRDRGRKRSSSCSAMDRTPG